MEHVAIMQKSWGLTEKIATGQKVIESRWYKVKYAPWRRIAPGEKVYFKNAGEPVTIQVEVDQVLYFSDLTPEKVQALLTKYGKDLGIDEPDMPKFFEMLKYKRYCMLIFLKKVQRIPPFEIDKTDFGMMSSWICVENVAEIRK